jgi:hypothetical protein
MRNTVAGGVSPATPENTTHKKGLELPDLSKLK